MKKAFKLKKSTGLRVFFQRCEQNAASVMVGDIDEFGIIRNRKYLGQGAGFILVEDKSDIDIIAAIGGRNLKIEFTHDNLPKKEGNHHCPDRE